MNKYIDDLEVCSYDIIYSRMWWGRVCQSRVSCYSTSYGIVVAVNSYVADMLGVVDFVIGIALNFAV